MNSLPRVEDGGPSEDYAFMHPGRTIMSAYYRRRGEDRVTEVLAAVLDQSDDFCEGLASLADLPAAPAYEVRTQVRSGAVTIDLELAGREPDGTTAWILWVEHKLYDPLTARQLKNEWEALAARAQSVRRELMAVTLLAPTPDAEAFATAHGCHLHRWPTITSTARRAQETLRSPARSSRMPALADHLLSEWMTFARHELETPVERLTREQVQGLPESEKARDTLAHLMRSGFTRACADIGAGTPREMGDELHAKPPQGSWLIDRGVSLYAKYVYSGGFGDVEDLCLVVGGWLEGEHAVSARRTRDLHTVLGNRELAIWDEEGRHGGWIEFALPMSLTELAGHGSLEAQDKAFGEVCLHALRTLVAPIP